MEGPEKLIREDLGRHLTLKKKSISFPDKNIGNKVSPVALENCVKCWSFSSSQQVQTSAKKVKDYHHRANVGPMPKDKQLWPRNYCPEEDVTPELTLLKRHIANP